MAKTYDTDQTAYYIGLDLGQQKDYAALTLLKRHGEWEQAEGEVWTGVRYAVRPVRAWTFKKYQVQHIERFPLKTAYYAIAEGVRTVQRDVKARTGLTPCAVVDATGARPAVEILKSEGVEQVYSVTITGGATVTRPEPDEYTVPKRDLTVNLVALYQAGALEINPALPYAQEHLKELQNFKLKINAKTGHDRYEHNLSTDHDDVALSTMLPAWFAEFGESTFEILGWI